MPCTWRLVACSTSADRFPWEPMAWGMGKGVEERKKKAEQRKVQACGGEDPEQAKKAFSETVPIPQK